MFDKTSLGATDFQQQVEYQRALEGEIDDDDRADPGRDERRRAARASRRTRCSLDQGSKATAAVLLTTDTQLDPSTVSGIAHLVASSVKGLDART